MTQHYATDLLSARLLTVCGSFRRPDKTMDMLQSWKETRSEGSEIVVYLSDDDPRLSEYLENFDLGDVNYVVGPHRFFIGALNYIIMSVLPGIPYYSAINDDHIYHTKNWDDILIRELENKLHGWGWVFSNDMIDNGKLNTHFNANAELYSWKFVKTLGYAYPPEFRQFGVDVWAQKFLRSIGCYLYVPEVVIEHKCGYALKEDNLDDNYKEAYTSAEAEAGYAIGDKWMREQYGEAVRRVKEGMLNENS